MSKTIFLKKKTLFGSYQDVSGKYVPTQIYGVDAEIGERLLASGAFDELTSGGDHVIDKTSDEAPKSKTEKAEESKVQAGKAAV